MEYASFSERVTLERERFTEFEEAFSLYAIANPEEVASQTIKDLAATFHIAPNAIMRLARKLDYEGFSEMRLALKREGGISTACQAAHEKGGRERAASRPGTLALVEKTLRLCCTRDHLLPAARILTGSKRTVFYAVGETAYITHAFANRMSDFDEKTHFLTYENQIRRELAHRDGLALVLVSLSEKL